MSRHHDREIKEFFVFVLIAGVVLFMIFGR